MAFRTKKPAFRTNFSHKPPKYAIKKYHTGKEVSVMKKLFQKCSGFLAALAIVVTTMNANTTCVFIMHQDSLPEEAKRLRKF